MGFGILACDGNRLSMLDMDVVKLNGKKDMFERLGIINQTIQSLIERYQPTAVAIEAPFFGKNVQSMLKLGRAQGVAIAVAMSNQIPVSEYSPKKVKQSITGNGNSDKEQVWKMLNRIVPLKHTLRYYDASDALAVAVCHHFAQHGTTPSAPTMKKKAARAASSWETFLKNNPERLRK